jgi:hypothetical protein
MTKFTVGDKVRVSTKAGFKGVGTVTTARPKIMSEGIYNYSVDFDMEGEYLFKEHELTLLEEDNDQAK